MSAQPETTDSMHLLDEQDEDERAFLESLGLTGERPEEPARMDAYVDRLLEVIAGARAEVEKNNDAAALRMKMIGEWRDTENAPLERRIEWAERQIRDVARSYDFGRKKSRNLPYGKFGYRKKPATVTIVDQEKAVAFAEARGAQIKKSVNKTPLIDALTVTESGTALVDSETGEILDADTHGFRYEPAEDRFYVKTGGTS